MMLARCRFQEEAERTAEGDGRSQAESRRQRTNRYAITHMTLASNSYSPVSVCHKMALYRKW